ncbi:hypothetical protein TWF569_008302 [Orbilia oligospora]|nr:hypothetical protein TWF706_006971 [Orbilia oligospora]KAF3140161.1 hypothetical protein TWF569_008302 [Orbilia oligospora]KAF3147428.1 hypothetical protein TWF594_002648 [Orbilia oligospora]
MASPASSSKVGGGLASTSQSLKPIEVASEAFTQSLIEIHKVVAPHTPYQEWVTSFLSPANNVILPPPARDSDLSFPLNNYFISSSHNTYLVDHQLYGKATVQGYVNVLERGCRCVEIDCWDGDDGEPKVDHGWTLTEAITFKSVCEAIGKHAFTHSDLPLMISLECHTSIEQQEKMVAIMKHCWGDKLLETELADWSVVDKKLPPPGLLKNRILVKTIFKQVKYLPPDAQPGAPAPVQELTSQTTNLSIEDEDESEGDPDVKKKAPKVKICRALSSLGVYSSAMTFPNTFDHPSATRPNHIFSFSEKKFNKLHEEQTDALFTHNRHYLARIYPHGLRISSSNLNPQEFWRRGAQLVALNWQKVDKGITFNEAMFAGTGGYVLKPDSHLSNLATPRLISDLKKDVRLKIVVIAGQSLPLPKGDTDAKGFQPYVKVVLHLSQTLKQKHKTKHGKGVNVRWEKKNVLEYDAKGVVPELTFARFKVYDDEFGKDDKSAWACVRLDRLKTGYGHLRLFDMKGRETNGVLLLYIEKTVE